MANHANIFFEEQPSVEDILKIFDEVSKENNLNFVVDHAPSTSDSEVIHSFSFLHKDADPKSFNMGILYWLNKNKPSFGFDDEEITSVSDEKELEYIRRSLSVVDKPNLENRHGHSNDLLWWIEKLVNQKVQEKFKVIEFYDEGIGFYDFKKETVCPTYADYVKLRYNHLLEGKRKNISLYNRIMVEERDYSLQTLPKDLHEIVRQAYIERSEDEETIKTT